MERRGWEVVYATGKRARSWEGAIWEKLPATGVQFILEYFDPPYKQIWMGQDEYTLDEEEKILYGAWLDDDTFVHLTEIIMYEEYPEELK
jgi:hypothetical protein